MRARLIPLPELTERDLVAWRELASRSLEPNPFYEPEYVLPLARGLAQSSSTGVLAVSDGAEWLACLPVASGRWHRIPAPALSAWRGHPLYGMLGTPLASRNDSSAVLATLVRGMVASSRPVFAVLDWVADDGPVAVALAKALDRRSPAPIRFERFERAALRRRADPTYLEETLKAKRRRELRRQRRKLGEALGGEPVTIDRATSAGALEALIELEAAGRKGTSGTVMAADPAHARFFREMCRGFAAQGRLQLLCLTVDERIVAAQCNLTGGQTIFCLKVAFDERWASFSPGIQLQVDIVKSFHERSTHTLMDSCADATNSMINRLWPDRRPIASYVLPRDGLVGQLARPPLLMARSLRHRKQMRRAV